MVPTVFMQLDEIPQLPNGKTDTKKLPEPKLELENVKPENETEEKLFNMGIKTLSLFFIDEVAKYRCYDENGDEVLGEYGVVFEQEYKYFEGKRKLENLNSTITSNDIIEISDRSESNSTHKSLKNDQSVESVIETDLL